MPKKIPAITVHGRFQPPLHVNHWNFVKEGFDRAEFVTILITNPFIDEAHDSAASWRSDPTNNPFTYEERTEMFRAFFAAMGIDESRYEFRPFNIKQDESFKVLDPAVPNLVNVYSEWSEKKLDAFKTHGLQVIRLDQPKVRPVSGTLIRELISSTRELNQLGAKLVENGFMPEAVPGLLKVLSGRKNRA